MGAFSTCSLLNEFLPPETSAIEIYEGLSHPFFEKDELRNEILFGPRKIIQGHGFKHQRIEPDNVIKAFEAELWSESAIKPWGGLKGCGGFRADYCLRWKDKGVAYEVMICLGCSEVLFFRDGEALRCDLQREFFNHLCDLKYPDRD